MAPRRKITTSRQNEQPELYSSRMGTRSQTPASKASQGSTLAPQNRRDATTSNGEPKIETPASNEKKGPSTPPQKVTEAGKRFRTSVSDELTKANLAELSIDYEGIPDSPLSSPTVSMKEALDEYFDWSSRGSSSISPVQREHEERATGSVGSPSGSEEIAGVIDDTVAQADISGKERCNATASDLCTTVDVSAPNSTESHTCSRKRSISFADELAFTDPPVKADHSRAIARPRRTAQSKSPSISSQDDLASKLDEVAASADDVETATIEPLRRSKRARTGGKTVIEFDPDDVELPYDEATELEIEGWEGWLEMESSPETLTVMMQEWGVRGMKAIDVWSLEPEDLVVLPQPVHGLIFCYPYRDGDWSEQMDPCPDHVWFANQVDGTNACGTVALMNIINNVPNAKLGPALRSFRSDTQAMNAVERGDYLNNFRPIKAVHNSFIHVTEMMEDDLAAEKDYVTWAKKADSEAKKKMKARLAIKKKKAAEKAARKQQRAAARAARKAFPDELSPEGPRGSSISKLAGGVARPGVATIKKAPTKKANAANIKKKMVVAKEPKKETPAMAKAAAKKKADALARARHHYVAYLPIKGEIWKLDGMDDEPLNLGPCDATAWIDSVAPLIQASMADLSQESIDFSLLAVVQDPLYNDMMDLAANIKTMQQMDEKLAAVDPDWPMHEDAGDCLADESLEGPSEDYNITEEIIGEAAISHGNLEDLKKSDSVGSLLKLKRSLISQQKMLKSSIRSGKAEEDKRQAQVNIRRRDFGPLIQWQLMDLMDEGVLDELLDLHDPKKQNSGGAGGSVKKGNGKAKSKGKGKGRTR